MPNFRRLNNTVTNLAKNSQKGARRLHETAAEAVDTANNINNIANNISNVKPDYVGRTLSTIDTSSGIAAMATAFAAPALIGGIGYTGKATQWVGTKTGIAPNAGSSLIKAHDYVNKNFMEKTLGETKLGNQYATVVDRIMSPFHSAAKTFDNMTGLLSSRANARFAKAETFGSKAANITSDIAPHLPQEMHEHLHGLLSAAKSGDMQAFGNHNKALAEIKGLHDLDKPVAKAFNQATKFAEKQIGAVEKAMGLSNLAKGHHNTLDNVKNTTLHKGYENSLWALGSVTSTTIAVKDTLSDIDAFRGLVADLKGISKDQVTAGDAFYGELPRIGNQARRMLLLTAPPRAILEGINQLFNINMILGKGMNMAAIVLPIIGSQAIGAFTSGNILDTYKEMKKNEMNGIENDVDSYVKLIGAAHKDLHDRLGAESSFAKEVGRIYAQKHATVREVLRDVQDGSISQLLEHIKQVNTQQEKTAAETPCTKMNTVDQVTANAAVQKQHNMNDKSPNETLAPMESFVSHVSQNPDHSQPART